MTISGETIDYGPCAFMDGYDPAKVFSSIDQRGRYAFANQPGIGLWNLARLAETLLPLIDADTDKAVAAAEISLSTFRTLYEESFHAGVRRKLGLLTPQDGDVALASGLFDLMAQDDADFTLTFRSLGEDVDSKASDRTRTLFKDQPAFDAWDARWRERLAQDGGNPSDRQTAMLAANPKYIPRNHRVEEAIAAASEDGNFAPFEALLEVVTKPFDAQPGHEHYAAPPNEDERVLRTFCGT
jgi:serine/tyrosine/threonine adenylyltransferase